jgi:hypothetical protein
VGIGGVRLAIKHSVDVLVSQIGVFYAYGTATGRDRKRDSAKQVLTLITSFHQNCAIESIGRNCDGPIGEGK